MFKKAIGKKDLSENFQARNPNLACSSKRTATVDWVTFMVESAGENAVVRTGESPKKDKWLKICTKRKMTILRKEMKTSMNE